MATCEIFYRVFTWLSNARFVLEMEGRYSVQTKISSLRRTRIIDQLEHAIHSRLSLPQDTRIVYWPHDVSKGPICRRATLWDTLNGTYGEISRRKCLNILLLGPWTFVHLRGEALEKMLSVAEKISPAQKQEILRRIRVQETVKSISTAETVGCRRRCAVSDDDDISFTCTTSDRRTNAPAATGGLSARPSNQSADNDSTRSRENGPLPSYSLEARNGDVSVPSEESERQPRSVPNIESSNLPPPYTELPEDEDIRWHQVSTNIPDPVALRRREPVDLPQIAASEQLASRPGRPDPVQYHHQTDAPELSNRESIASRLGIVKPVEPPQPQPIRYMYQYRGVFPGVKLPGAYPLN